MIFINKASVDAGQVKGTTTLPTGERNTALQASRYNENSELFVNTSNSPLSTDQYTQGARFDATGAMYVRPVETLGVPSNISYDGGLAFDGTTNALLVTTQPLARYMIGWPLDQRGFVCMGIAAAGPAPGPFGFGIIPGSEGNSNRALIDWDTSSGATSYQVYRNGALVQTINAPTLSWEDVYPGSHYADFEYTMFAVNGNGSTASFNNPQPWVTYIAPDTPVAPTAVAGNTDALITWVPPNNNNSAITQYQIVSYIGAASQTVQYATPPATSKTFTGLTNGVTYTFRIACTNGGGQSGYSTNSNAVTPSA